MVSMIEDQAERDCAMPHVAQQNCCRMDLIVFLWLLAQFSNCGRADTVAIGSRFAAMDILACHHLDRINLTGAFISVFAVAVLKLRLISTRTVTSLKSPRNKHNF